MGGYGACKESSQALFCYCHIIHVLRTLFLSIVINVLDNPPRECVLGPSRIRGAEDFCMFQVRGRAETMGRRNGNAANSMEKLDNVLECCQELGVIISPTRFGNLWIAPILSWHHQVID